MAKSVNGEENPQHEQAKMLAGCIVLLLYGGLAASIAASLYQGHYLMAICLMVVFWILSL